MEQYLMYLRKSRADLEAEARGEGESLARHRAALTETAKRMGIVVTDIYEEIVSGDTIAARPMMQQLLSEVEQGVWAGILVMEVERLARGDTIDQGIVAQAFKYSGTRIITPIKVYDPSNEFDEEYFEFGLFMSRREYKTINRRLQRGRLASVKEGKWAANKAPYGYRRMKLQGEKGFTLEPDEHAQTVRDIFSWYSSGELGISLIVRRLNESRIASPSGQDWTGSVIRGILSNPAYAGNVRWGGRACVKRVVDGVVKVSRPRAKAQDCQVVKGLHPALVTEDAFHSAQVRLAENPSRPGSVKYACANPLAGLVYCADCGRAMVRRPYSSGYPDGLLCPYTSCRNVSSTLGTVEASILNALKLWTDQAEAEYKASARPSELHHIETAIAAADRELAGINVQIQRAYELVEQSTYSPETFLERTRELAVRKDAAEHRRETMQTELDRQHRLQEQREQLVPRIRSVLEAYPNAKTPEEKNELLKRVLEKAVYKKTVRERWNPDGSDMKIMIYPKMPK